MTDAQLLEKIKSGLGITGNYQDATLQIYIDEVKAFLVDAGVASTVVNSDAAVGCILRGVSDLWNYGSGGVDYSKAFQRRLIQLTRDGTTSTEV